MRAESAVLSNPGTRVSNGGRGRFDIYPISLEEGGGKFAPQIHDIKVLEGIFGECLNYKSGHRILIWPLEVPFFLVRKRPLLPKVPIFETKKMALRVAKSKF